MLCQIVSFFFLSRLVSSAPQNAPQFIPASVAAITLEAANKAALKAAQLGAGRQSADLLSAADEGLIPVGITQISQVNLGIISLKSV